MTKVLTWLKKFGWIILLVLATVLGYLLLMRKNEITAWTLNLRKKIAEIDNNEREAIEDNRRKTSEEIRKVRAEIEASGIEEDKRIAKRVEEEYKGQPDKICEALNRIVKERKGR